MEEGHSLEEEENQRQRESRQISKQNPTELKGESIKTESSYQIRQKRKVQLTQTCGIRTQEYKKERQSTLGRHVQEPKAKRYTNIVELGIADEVVLQDVFIPDPKVDIIAKAEGAGWTKNKTPKFKAETKLLNYTDGISTSEIIKRIHDSK